MIGQDRPGQIIGRGKARDARLPGGEIDRTGPRMASHRRKPAVLAIAAEHDGQLRAVDILCGVQLGCDFGNPDVPGDLVEPASGIPAQGTPEPQRAMIGVER
ncbi:hypothetical protein [Novosphingobium sp.]|uniref:hypothetical protein n=1 Tax=Novosphingobium sp. TaxID=1874826 RepID=UPI003BAD7380